MGILRRGFYLLIGFTFPGFWMLHASGFAAGLYKPVQILCATTAVGWPSLLTASLLYGGLVLCFETIRLLATRLSRE